MLTESLVPTRMQPPFIRPHWLLCALKTSATAYYVTILTHPHTCLNDHVANSNQLPHPGGRASPRASPVSVLRKAE